jgi:hypothetical protein
MIVAVGDATTGNKIMRLSAPNIPPGIGIAIPPRRESTKTLTAATPSTSAKSSNNTLTTLLGSIDSICIPPSMASLSIEASGYSYFSNITPVPTAHNTRPCTSKPAGSVVE